MKKLLVLSFICAAGFIACGKKIMPESGANNQSNPATERSARTAGAAGASTQSSSTNASGNSAFSFTDMKGIQAPIPDGSKQGSLDAGKTVYVTKCTGCHALKNPSDYTVDQTYAYLKTEISRAKLSKKDADEVTAYLIANAKR